MQTTFTHKIVAFLLASLLLTYSIKSTGTLVSFMIHQDQIAKTLCVQKDNQVDCFGKCQLVKALKEDVQSSMEFPAQNTQKLVLNFDFIQPIHKLQISTFSEVKKTTIVDAQDKTVMVYYDVLTPPPLVS